MVKRDRFPAYIPRKKTRFNPRRSALWAPAAAIAAAGTAGIGAYRWFNNPTLKRTGGFGNMYKKFKDFTYTLADLGDTIAGSEVDPTTPLCLNGVQQGNGESSYIGRGYDLVQIFVKGYIEWHNYSTASSRNGDLVRILLVWDKQTNGAQFNAEDVLKDPSGGNVNAMRNLEYTHRFIVLKDMILKQPTLGFASTADDEAVKQPFKISHNFKKSVKVLTKTAGATIADINDNSFHLMAYCSRASSTAKLQYTSRIRFHG